MIAWILSNSLSQLLWLALGLYAVNGVRKALFKPRLRVISFSKTKAGEFVETERQQLLPPWLTIKETWMAEPNQTYRHDYSTYKFTDYLRESDGVAMSSGRFKLIGHPLSLQLTAALSVKKAREAETDELLKEERKAAN